MICVLETSIVNDNYYKPSNFVFICLTHMADLVAMPTIFGTWYVILVPFLLERGPIYIGYATWQFLLGCVSSEV